MLQKASGEWGWLSPEPVIPRNRMGGSTPICYNRVNSKLLLTVETPINFAASPWVIFRKVAEFSSGVRGLPGTEYWDMR